MHLGQVIGEVGRRFETIFGHCRCSHPESLPLTAAVYRPRNAEHAVLYRVIDDHLEAFLETAKRQAGGSRSPQFVEQEFRDFLTCGVLAHCFACLRCAGCALVSAVWVPETLGR